VPDAVRRKRERGQLIELGTFPQLNSAPTWAALYDALWSRAVNAHGTVQARNGWSGKPSDAPPGFVISGTAAPRVTNAEAVQLVRAFNGIAKDARLFPLWDQYAALAYGWDPPARDTLDNSAPRGARSYNGDVGVALWLELHAVCKQLDSAQVPADLPMPDDFADPAFMGAVQASLQRDGASATFKIPTGRCIDSKTGKGRLPRIPCDKDGKRRDPITGVEVECDTPATCKPELVDDPLTALVKSLWPLALVVGAVWLLTRQPRRARRYRD
jgi:hypothetical protein